MRAIPELRFCNFIRPYGARLRFAPIPASELAGYFHPVSTRPGRDWQPAPATRVRTPWNARRKPKAQGCFDCTGQFASEPAGSAQHDREEQTAW